VQIHGVGGVVGRKSETHACTMNQRLPGWWSALKKPGDRKVAPYEGSVEVHNTGGLKPPMHGVFSNHHTSSNCVGDDVATSRSWEMSNTHVTSLAASLLLLPGMQQCSTCSGTHQVCVKVCVQPKCARATRRCAGQCARGPVFEARDEATHAGKVDVQGRGPGATQESVGKPVLVEVPCVNAAPHK
jgi:hypothetical protein